MAAVRKTHDSGESLLKKAQRRLSRLSAERLRVADDFLAYLEERESNEATEELLRVPGLIEAFEVARQQVAAGDVVRFRDVRRDV